MAKACFSVYYVRLSDPESLRFYFLAIKRKFICPTSTIFMTNTLALSFNIQVVSSIGLLQVELLQCSCFFFFSIEFTLFQLYICMRVCTGSTQVSAGTCRSWRRWDPSWSWSSSRYWELNWGTGARVVLVLNC